MARIGLVAGEGVIPLLFASAAKSKGDTVISLGLKGMTDPALEKASDRMHWLEWGDYKKALLLAATERVSRIALVGKIKKELLFKDSGKLDEKARAALSKMRDRKDYAIFGEVAGALSKFGITIVDASEYLKDLLPSRGVLTKRAPTPEEASDMEYGADVARHMAGLDIGQTVIIKDRTVIAVEAVEGTDETIRRAGKLVEGGFVAVKMARPGQDMRFDVPACGLNTIRNLIESGGTAFAMEEKKTFFTERDEAVKLADSKGLSIAIL